MPTKLSKARSPANLPAVASAGPAADRVCALLNALVLAHSWSFSVCVCFCLCTSVCVLCSLAHSCSFVRTPSKPATPPLDSITHPGFLRDTLKSGPSVSQGQCCLFCVAFTGGRGLQWSVQTRYRLYIIALTRIKNRPCFVGQCFRCAIELLPIQNMIPGTKWVCCVYGFECCQEISYARRRQYSRGKVGYRSDCRCFWLKDKWKMWDIFRHFTGKHNSQTTLSFGSHYQMAHTVLQMYLDSNMFFDVLTLHYSVQEKL